MTESNAATKEIEGEIVATPPAASALVEAPVIVPAEQGSAALMRMIEKAIENPDFDVAKMEQLLTVKERWEATEARKAFVRALAAFKANPPEIVKDKHVTYTLKTGGTTDYHHATLGQVCDVVGKALAVHGLSHTWQIKQHDDAAIEVTCVLTHAMGHAERVTMRGMPDSSGSKNLIQQVGSTTTYLQRYTLLAATGLATADQDTDGAGPDEPISDEQKGILINLMRESGANTVRFLKLLGVNSLDELPASAFGAAKLALKAKQTAEGEKEE